MQLLSLLLLYGNMLCSLGQAQSFNIVCYVILQAYVYLGSVYAMLGFYNYVSLFICFVYIFICFVYIIRMVYISYIAWVYEHGTIALVIISISLLKQINDDKFGT